MCGVCGVMNGLHIPGTPMVVDYWKTKNLAPRMLFFLTHMHAGEVVLEYHQAMASSL